MLLTTLRQYKNEKMPEANGLWFAYPVITQTIDINGLAAHMASHNTPFSKGAIKGMITDMVICVKELASQGFAIKIDDLAIFSIGIKNKMGAKTEKEFSVQKNIEGFKLRARGTGEFKATNLDISLNESARSAATTPPTRILTATPLQLQVALMPAAAATLTRVVTAAT